MLTSWYSLRVTFGTSMLWVEGEISSYFLEVKMSVATKWTLACPCFPVLEVDMSTIWRGERRKAGEGRRLAFREVRAVEEGSNRQGVDHNQEPDLSQDPKLFLRAWGVLSSEGERALEAPPTLYSREETSLLPIGSLQKSSIVHSSSLQSG